MVFEFLVGFLSGSLILIADAAHNLTDSFTLAISWVANRLSKKPADEDHSLGHGRISVLGAYINSIILVIMAVLIFFEAYQRFSHPQELKGGVIAIVGAVGILANGIVALLFRKDRNDLKVKAAYTNMAFDAGFSIAALIAGILISITSKTWIDPLISIGVGIGLLYAAFGILGQSIHIFLEGVPKDINLKELRQIIDDNNQVAQVHDLAVWAISSNEYVICCRLSLHSQKLNENKETIQVLKKQLHKHGLNKIFIEVE